MHKVHPSQRAAKLPGHVRVDFQALCELAEIVELSVFRCRDEQ
jgi:hypothetical protein